MKKLNKKGFTLTEMIVVIAIIGILAAVLIPSVVIYVNRAKESNDNQLAASMSDEIERYCIINNIDQSKLSGTDIRTILISKGYNLSPSSNNWSYFYNEEKRIVEVKKFKDLSSGSGEYDDLTELVKGYYLIGKGKTDIELLVSELSKGNYSYYTQNSSVLSNYSDYKTMLDNNYSYDKTLYIGTASILNPQLTGPYSNIVFAELVSYIPNITLDENLLADDYKVENANFLFVAVGNGNLAEIIGAKNVKKLDVSSFSSSVSVSLPDNTTIDNFEAKVNLTSNSTDNEVQAAGGYLSESEINSLIFTIGSDFENSSYQIVTFGCDNEEDKIRSIWKMTIIFMGTDGVVGYKEVYYDRSK